MQRTLIKLFPATVIALGIATLLFPVLNVNASSKSQAASLGNLAQYSSCQVLRVVLHGSLTPGLTCLRSSGPNSPDIAETQCASNDLKIWRDINAGGPEICFTNVGGPLNMTNFPLAGSPTGTWNDQASSADTGGWCTEFFTDINDGGAGFGADGSVFFNFSDTIGNDTLSSIQINGPC